MRFRNDIEFHFPIVGDTLGRKDKCYGASSPVCSNPGGSLNSLGFFSNFGSVFSEVTTSRVPRADRPLRAGNRSTRRGSKSSVEKNQRAFRLLAY